MLAASDVGNEESNVEDEQHRDHAQRHDAENLVPISVEDQDESEEEEAARAGQEDWEDGQDDQVVQVFLLLAPLVANQELLVSGFLVHVDHDWIDAIFVVVKLLIAEDQIPGLFDLCLLYTSPSPRD